MSFILQLLIIMAVASAATRGRDYLPRPPAKAYVYPPPSPSTMAALRRIIQGHLDRFHQAELNQQAQQQQTQFSRRALAQQTKPEVGQKPQAAMQVYVVSGAASDNVLEYAVPPNSPTPKNYAQNFLPEGKDVVPGSSYIPLRLLVIKR
ncbi:hypothetical protein KR038_002856 [Drosophila bunnanda]|nr:hypothetical protein KR038_002856 [Drosophila bunnanda]